MTLQPIVSVITGALIAAAIALTNHWTGDPPSVLRMDRWTGRVFFCAGVREPGPGWIVSCSGEGSPNRLDVGEVTAEAFAPAKRLVIP